MEIIFEFRRAQIFLIGSIIYFAPTASRTVRMSKMVGTILTCSINDTPTKIGEVFQENISNCIIGDVPDEVDYYQKLLNTSNQRDNTEFVSNAEYISANKDKGIITLKRIGKDLKYNAWMVDLGIEPVVLDADKSTSHDVGLAIIELFSK